MKLTSLPEQDENPWIYDRPIYPSDFLPPDLAQARLPLICSRLQKFSVESAIFLRRHNSTDQKIWKWLTIRNCPFRKLYGGKFNLPQFSLAAVQPVRCFIYCVYVYGSIIGFILKVRYYFGNKIRKMRSFYCDKRSNRIWRGRSEFCIRNCWKLLIFPVMYENTPNALKSKYLKQQWNLRRHLLPIYIYTYFKTCFCFSGGL